MSTCQGSISTEDDVRYWKDRAEELERELEDFREQSQELEKELEMSLDQAEKRSRDYRTRCNKLQLENDSLKDKLEQVTKESSVQISEMQEELSQCRNREEELVKYIRELEQKNDDLERTQRAMFVSLGEFEAKLNVAIERNALLESELDEKESLQAMVQRLKDEARGAFLTHSDIGFFEQVCNHLKSGAQAKQEETEHFRQPSKEANMKQEIVVQKRQEKNDNDKCLERIHSGQLDSNKLVTAEIETQTLSSPLKSIGPNNNPLPPPTRISAMNIVGDVLRKVGALEMKLASCRNPYRERPLQTDITNDTFREYTRHNSLSGRRLHRGTSTPSMHNYIRS